MLLDTSGLLCLFDKAERRHEAAQTYHDAATRLFVHSYILAEFIPLSAARRLPRAKALPFASDLINSGNIEVVWVDAWPSRSWKIGSTSLIHFAMPSASSCHTWSFQQASRRA